MSVVGWPSKLRWDQFKPLDAPPAGASIGGWTHADPDASIHPLLAPPQVFSIVPDAKHKTQRRFVNFNITVKLDSLDTWVVKDKQSDKLLKHEQGHWDIAGLVGREWHRRLEWLRAETDDGLMKLARDTKQYFQSKLDSLTGQYDDETKNGSEDHKQLEWNSTIGSFIGKHFLCVALWFADEPAFS